MDDKDALITYITRGVEELAKKVNDVFVIGFRAVPEPIKTQFDDHTRRANTYVSVMRQVNLAALPSDVLTQSKNNIAQALSQLDQVARHIREDGQISPAAIGEIQMSLNPMTFQLGSELGTPIVLMTLLQSRLLSPEGGIVASIEPYRTRIESYEHSARRSAAAAEQAEADARNAAQKIGNAEVTKYFEKLSDKHKDAYRKSIWLSTALLIVLIVLATDPFKLWPVPDTSDLSKYFATNSAKIFTILTIGYVISFVVRMAVAERHNAVAFLTRTEILHTYQAILAEEKDDQRRSALLQQAATAIFTIQDTGFVKANSDAASLSDVIALLSKAK